MKWEARMASNRRATRGPRSLEAVTYEAQGAPLVAGVSVHVGIYHLNQRRHTRRTRQRGPCLVAVVDGGIVAHARLGSTYTVGAYRGRGIGSALYAEVLRRWPTRARQHYARGLLTTAEGEAQIRRAWCLLDGEPPSSTDGEPSGAFARRR